MSKFNNSSLSANSSSGRLLIHLGTQKAASTTLWQLVRQNPQIATHTRNELEQYKRRPGSEESYLGHFPTSATHLFENSPKYFSTAETPSRIASEMQASDLRDNEFRFSVVLRDPVGYLFSLYTMYHYQGVLEQRGNPIGKVVLRALGPFAGLRRTVGRSLGAVGLRGRVRDGLRGNAAPLASEDVSEEARETTTRACKSGMMRLSALLGAADLPWPSFKILA